MRKLGSQPAKPSTQYSRGRVLSQSLARSRLISKLWCSRGRLTGPHQMSDSVCGLRTMRLSLGERPVLGPL